MYAHEKKAPQKTKQSVRQSPFGNGSVSTLQQMAGQMGNQAMLACLGQRSEPSAEGKPLSDALREKFERKSGVPLDDVRVHYNSDKPEQLGAEAYAQGNEIFIGPGNEQDLEHELGHVVQQKQGLVKPTESIGVNAVNSDPALEHTAELGQLRMSASLPNEMSGLAPIQMLKIGDEEMTVDEYVDHYVNSRNYDEYAKIYHEASFPGNDGVFSYQGKTIALPNHEKQKILDAYERLSQWYGPILKDQIGDAQGDNAMQYGFADSTQKIVYPGLDSCIGVTMEKISGEKFGVHLVLPFEAQQQEAYADRLEKLSQYSKNANMCNPVVRVIVSCKSDKSDVDTHLESLKILKEELFSKLNGILGGITVFVK